MFSIKSKIDARLEARRNGESGLALLDVLLGMAIFALIAVIAVQAMGTFRERAYVSQATSDVKQLGTGIEAALTAPNATFNAAAGTGIFSAAVPAATRTQLVAADLTKLGVNLTGSNTAWLTGASPSSYVICVTGNSKEARYSATTGAITTSGNGTCA